LLTISLSGFSQELPKEKSGNHIHIEGTNIFMIPPSTYESSTNFKGFQNPYDQTSMIMTMEIPIPYSEVTKGYTTEMLKTRGKELKTKKEIKVANFNGLLIELDQPANELVFSKQILIYGDETSSTLINGVFLKDSIQLGKKIKESILSTFINIEVKSNPREALSYSLNENAGGLQFLSVVGNGMLFNRDLKTPTESDDKATLIADKSFAQAEINDHKQFCISRLKNYPEDYSVIPTKAINDIEIDGLKGYELFAKNNDTAYENMYQVILFDDEEGYYLFVGMYVATSEKAITNIKDIILTFSRKK